MGVINLDSNNGLGTHWACYVDFFYFDSFGLPPPENILFIKRYNTSQYLKKKKKKKEKRKKEKKKKKKDILSLWSLLSFFH